MNLNRGQHFLSRNSQKLSERPSKIITETENVLPTLHKTATYSQVIKQASGEAPLKNNLVSPVVVPLPEQKPEPALAAPADRQLSIAKDKNIEKPRASPLNLAVKTELSQVSIPQTQPVNSERGRAPSQEASWAASSSLSSRLANSSLRSDRNRRLASVNIGKTRDHLNLGQDRMSRVVALTSMDKKHQGSLKNFSAALGPGFNYTNGDFYGKKTAIVADYSQLFLREFFYHSEHRRTLRLHQSERHAAQAKTQPPCIAFATLELQDEAQHKLTEACLISVSRPQVTISQSQDIAADNRVIEALKANIREMEKQYPNKRYFLVSHCSKNYNNMLHSSSSHAKDNKMPEKSCAEKFLSSALDKFFTHFGERLKVTGLITCDFYPFIFANVKKGNLYDGITEQPRFTKDDLILKHKDQADYRITVKPACNECALNKCTHFYSWRLSQRIAELRSQPDPQVTTLSRTLSDPSEVGGEAAALEYFLAAEMQPADSSVFADLAASVGNHHATIFSSLTVQVEEIAVDIQVDGKMEAQLSSEEPRELNLPKPSL